MVVQERKVRVEVRREVVIIARVMVRMARVEAKECVSGGRVVRNGSG